MSKKELGVGDVVGYRWHWLRDNGKCGTAFQLAAGRIEELSAKLARVSWSHEDVPDLVDVRCLCRAGTRREIDA